MYALPLHDDRSKNAREGERVATEELSFEESFEKLETTVRQLEAGDLAIEEAVTLYEEGMELARICQQRLDAVELRVSRLVPLPNGEYGVVALDSMS